jgi:hypothetical protein
METRVLMGLSAAFMAGLGLTASFLPQELLGWSGSQPGGTAVLAIQAAGALYLGFGMLNWMARTNLIGGIYSRPVALGNFIHFAVVAVVLLKALLAGQLPAAMAAVAVAYAAFAAWFGFVLFTHPGKAPEP